jgi:hypothetical protein
VVLSPEEVVQFLRLFRSGDDVFEGPVLFETDFIQEAKCGNGNKDRTGSQLLFLRQVDLIGTNSLSCRKAAAFQGWHEPDESRD